MTNTNPEHVSPISAEDILAGYASTDPTEIAIIKGVIEQARWGYTLTPPNRREVWGVQVGTWPPEKMQTEAQARWYADQPYTAVRNGQTYPVHIVKGTEYGTDWQIVETWEDGFQQ